MSATIGSLFSGIGGLELGLEACGLGPVLWQCDSDPYARAVLEAHWPGVKRYNDVREIDERAERPDIICGGFPCQDISDAGTYRRRRGLNGTRSGLWREFARVIQALRPHFVFVENVASLAQRGLAVVLRDLAALGFDAEWGCFCGCWAGAHHARERLFLVACTHGNSQPARPVDAEMASVPEVSGRIRDRRLPFGRAMGMATRASAPASPAPRAIARSVPAVALLPWRWRTAFVAGSALDTGKTRRWVTSGRGRRGKSLGIRERTTEMPCTIKCKLWAVLDLDDEDAPPLAAFPTKAEADGFVWLTGVDKGCIDVEVCEVDAVIEVPDEVPPDQAAPFPGDQGGQGR